MSQQAAPVRRRTAIGLALALLLAAIATPAVAQQQAPRTYSAAVAPTTACAAPQSPTVEVTLKNWSTTQVMGSANIDVSGLGVPSSSVAVSVTAGGTTTLSATLVRGTIQVRNAAVPPLGEAIVSFQVSAAPGSYTLTTQAKQANNFSGPPGNDLILAGSQPVLTLESCRQDWTIAWQTQPADAEKAPSTVPGLTGPSPQVKLTDGSGAGVSGIPITVTLRRAGADVPFATGSTATVPTNGSGVATFADLRVSTSGQGYTLSAATAGVSAVSSTSFTVYDDLCDPNTVCTTTGGDLRNDNLTANASGTAGSSGGALLISVQPPDLTLGDCVPPPSGQSTRLPTEVELLGVDLVNKTVEIRISKAYDQLVAQKGAAHYDVCAQPQEPTTQYSFFPDAYTGQTVGLGQWGYLPNCSAVNQQTVCVLSRTKNKGEPVITVFWGSGIKFR